MILDKLETFTNIGKNIIDGVDSLILTKEEKAKLENESKEINNETLKIENRRKEIKLAIYENQQKYLNEVMKNDIEAQGKDIEEKNLYFKEGWDFWKG